MTERLDRIERILESLAERQDQAQERQDRLQEQQDRFQLQQDRLQERQDRFQLQLEDLNADVDAVLRMVQTLAEEGQRDREDIRIMQTEIRGLQSENRRILDYLLNQQDGENL